MTIHADLRQQQQAAAAFAELLRHADHLDTIEQWDAASEVAQAAHQGHPLLADGGLTAWKRSWDTGSRDPLPVLESERDDAHRLTRAILAATGELRGPTLRLATGLEIRVGDQLVVEPPVGVGYLVTDTGDRLDRGAPGTVTAVDADTRTFDLQVPTVACTHTLRADSDHAAGLTYGYTTETDRLAEPEPAAGAGRVTGRTAGRTGGMSL